MADQSEYLYDLFIAYAAADHAWVAGYLAEGLRAAGVRCRLTADLAAGGVTHDDLTQAVTSSWGTLIVLSPAFVAADLEAMLALLEAEYGPEPIAWPIILIERGPAELPPDVAAVECLDASEPARWPAVL